MHDEHPRTFSMGASLLFSSCLRLSFKYRGKRRLCQTRLKNFSYSNIGQAKQSFHGKKVTSKGKIVLRYFLELSYIPCCFSWKFLNCFKFKLQILSFSNFSNEVLVHPFRYSKSIIQYITKRFPRKPKKDMIGSSWKVKENNKKYCILLLIIFLGQVLSRQVVRL